MDSHWQKNGDAPTSTFKNLPIYDVFISHAAEDTVWCESLAARLSDAGLRVWLDTWQMNEAGIDLIDGMEKGLQQSRRAVLVLTPDYLAERKIWAAAERRYITYQQLTGRREFAIPILLKDCTPPPFLRLLKTIDFRNATACEANLLQLIKILKDEQSDETIMALAKSTDAVPQPTQLPPNSCLPYDWNPYFVGREAELKKLHQLLNRGKSLVAANELGIKVAVAGLGGIGKTQLAIEYAFRYGGFYSGGVYWVNADQNEDLQSALADLAIPMGLNLPKDLSDKDRAAHVLAVLRRPEPRLLILDNVTNSGILNQCNVAGGGCRLLVTTRRTDLERFERLSLDVLDKKSAVILLRSRRAHSGILGEQSIYEKICERLGYLPLALELAAFYLGRHKQMPPADYAEHLDTISTLDRFAFRGSGYKQSPTGYGRGVVESFQLSFRELAKAPRAQKLFFAMCQFELETINPSLLGKVAAMDLSQHDGEEALNQILDLSLCKQNEQGRLQLHRLIIECGRNATPQKVAKKFKARFQEVMLEFIEKNSGPTELNCLQPELPHVIHAAAIAMSQKAWPRAFALCRKIGEHLYSSSDYSSCLIWFQSAKKACQGQKPVNQKNLAEILNDIGMALNELGFEDKAMANYKQAFIILKKAVGEKDIAIVRCLKNIGDALLLKGKLDGALSNFKEALELEYKSYGKDHPNVASTLHSIGLVLFERWDLAGALMHFKLALNIRQKTFGHEHPGVAESHRCIGSVLFAQGDLKTAMSHYRKALAVLTNIFGEEHLVVAPVLHNIGEVLQAQEDRSAAVEYWQRALIIFEKFLGPEHFSARNVRENLSDLKK